MKLLLAILFISVCQILSMSIEGESSLTFEYLEEQVELLEIKNKELKAKVHQLEGDSPPSQYNVGIRAFSAQPNSSKTLTGGQLIPWERDDLQEWGLLGSSVFLCDNNHTSTRGVYLFTVTTVSQDSCFYSTIERTSSNIAYTAACTGQDENGVPYLGESTGTNTVILSCDDFTNIWVQATSTCNSIDCTLFSESRFTGALLYNA